MAAADIVDVVGEFVTLRRSGANYKGLCPFHDEKTPSFMVSPSKQLCKCFSCGNGGNVVKFVMQHEQMTYPEALKWLGRRYGIEVKEREQSEEEKAAATAREAMFVVNEWARDYFVETLHNNVDGLAIGMSYFRRRGLRDDIIRKFQLGYSLEQRDALAQGPDKPPVPMLKLLRRRSISTLIPIKVLMSDTESAPSASTARAISAMSVTLGESFTINVLG